MKKLLAVVCLAFSTPVWAWPPPTLLELLELERTVIYVDSRAPDSLDVEDGYCSLREAIRNANANAQVHIDCEAGSNTLDTISLPADTYTFALTGTDEDEGATGDLDITETVTLSADYYVIDADFIDRIFHVVSADATLTLEGLYLYHGIANEGGAILSAGNLRLYNTVLYQNYAYDTAYDGEAKGGGISIRGPDISTTDTYDPYSESPEEPEDSESPEPSIPTLTLEDSSIFGNLALSNGSTYGAGVYAENTNVTVTNSSFSQNVNLAYLEAHGGGLSMHGKNATELTLTVSDSFFDQNVITGSTAMAIGGGIDLEGVTSATIDDTEVVDNAVYSFGRGGHGEATKFYGAGLSFLNGDNLNISTVTISRNGNFLIDGRAWGKNYKNHGSEAMFGGGVFLASVNDSNISQSTISANSNSVSVFTPPDSDSALSKRVMSGGGIYYYGSGVLNISETTVSGNSNSIHSTICGIYEHTDAYMYGGGIYVSTYGNLNISDSTISENELVADDYQNTAACLTSGLNEGYGGGIYTGGVSERSYLSRSTISKNSISGSFDTAHGGGSYTGSRPNVEIFQSTISENSISSSYYGESDAYDLSGGGLYFMVNSIITNSTISNNSVETPADGEGNGGGISYNDYDHRLANSTIAQNQADNGGGIYMSSPATLTLKNTLIAENISTTFGNDFACSADLTTTPLFSDGYNLVGDGDCGTFTFTSAVGDQVGTTTGPIDPMLGDLDDNGGPTKTHALERRSPAIDAGNPLGCSLFDIKMSLLILSKDQRGFNRPEDGNGNGKARCDIGAFERQELDILADNPLKLKNPGEKDSKSNSSVNGAISF